MVQALVLEKAGKLVLRDIDLPQTVGPNDVRIAIDTVGVCGSDIHYYTHGKIGPFLVKSPMVLGHEAAHHIAGHIGRQQQNAMAGAVIFAGIATLSGGDATAVRTAQELGAEVGARRYSKDFELEADALGTIITARAGYNPLRGAEFFTRIPDPGDRFLGTHPPNASRLDTVRRTAAGL